MGAAASVLTVVDLLQPMLPHPVLRSAAVLLGGFGGYHALLANEKVWEQTKSLQSVILRSRNPDIMVLKSKYPYLIVDRDGNLVGVTEEKLLKIFGRQRVRTRA